MTPLRILEIASELPPVQSGVARAAGIIVDGLTVRGHTVDSLSSVDAPRRYLGEFRLTALGMKWLRLERLVNGYDIVHLTGPAPFIADSLLARWRVARGARLPPLVYTHGFTLAVDAAPRLSAAYRGVTDPLLNAADTVVVTTPAYERLVTKHYRGPVRVIPWASGLDPLPLSGRVQYSTSRALRVLFVGQQRPYKGIDHLIQAAAGLGRVEVTIIGGGPLVDHYRAEIRRLSATNITHRGRVDDPELLQAFADHDVICLPSTNASEAFGLVLVEAMSQGCVAVASRLPGVDDVVGEAGILVPPRDPWALRAALDGLARQPRRVADLQRAAQEKAATYSWQRSVEQYEQLYVELASDSSRR